MGKRKIGVSELAKRSSSSQIASFLGNKAALEKLWYRNGPQKNWSSNAENISWHLNSKYESS